MFNVTILSTGSKGNCVVVDEKIMLDAGIPKKRIVDGNQIELDKITTLFVSHKHKDHANLPMIRWAIKKKLHVHLPQDVITMLVNEGKIDVRPYINETLFVHENQSSYTLNLGETEVNEPYEVTVHLYPQKHYDIVNYALVLEKVVKNEPFRLLYSTDLDTIQPTDIGQGLVELGMFDTILLEGNYDEIWLRDYINVAIASVDTDMDTGLLSDIELDTWVRAHYHQLPKSVAKGLFRAVQNMRHLSKQQARMYARKHLNRNGVYYEMHPSSLFYERPDDWDNILFN